MRFRLFAAALLLPLLASPSAQAYGGDQIYAAPGRLVDIGQRRLNLYCTGRGTSTVVLESGLGGRASAWARVQRALSRTARVCSYDRAGYAFSDPALCREPQTNSPANFTPPSTAQASADRSCWWAQASEHLWYVWGPACRMAKNGFAPVTARLGR
jgi:pimeloyl-ACP methyl ester carboxylesterase